METDLRFFKVVPEGNRFEIFPGFIISKVDLRFSEVLHLSEWK